VSGQTVVGERNDSCDAPLLVVWTKRTSALKGSSSLVDPLPVHCTSLIGSI
jgi:hypothetical protein